MRNSLYSDGIKELGDELDELRARVEDIDDRKDEAEGPLEPGDGDSEAIELDGDEQDRLKELEGLETDIGDLHVAARNGAHLIHEDDFTEYAEQLADDLGSIPRDMQGKWPFTCINWEEAADELKADYSTVDFDGNTYYYQDW